MAKLSKETIETVKTVIIAVLVSSIIAFIGGNMYANAKNSELAQARATVTTTQVEVKK